MRNTKKPWGLKPKHKRRDNWNRMGSSHYERWCRMPDPVMEDDKSKRTRNRMACRKLLIGYLEEEVYLPTNKWRRTPDYY